MDSEKNIQPIDTRNDIENEIKQYHNAFMIGCIGIIVLGFYIYIAIQFN